MGSFKNILIPADLTVNTQTAIERALELDTNGSTIHLLYVQNYALPGLPGVIQQYLVQANELPGYKLIDERLHHWKKMILQQNNLVRVEIRIVMSESIQATIEKMVEELEADLLIIGKSHHHSWLPFLNTVSPGRIARKTGISVLTVKPGFNLNSTKTIVVPVAEEDVKEKMNAILMLDAKFKVKIHLVTFRDNSNKSYASPLLNMYQWLKTCVHCPVEYVILPGYNKARSILTYAEKIDADILLVHAGKETRIGWPQKHITDVLPDKSKLQVWAM